MTTKAEMKRRREFLREHLSTHADQDVPLIELGKEMARATNTPQVSAPQVARILRNMGPAVGGELTITRTTARLDIRADYVIDRRRLDRPQTKERLGRALWNVLFGAPLPANLKVEPDPFGRKQVGTASGWTTDTTNRLREIRQRMTAAIYVDAGSTTETAFKQLDEFRSLDFERDTNATGRLPMTPRLLVVTNSLSIAGQLCKSRHRYDLQPMIVGGQLRPEYESVSGMITQNVLTNFRLSGGIAVVGATGFRFESESGGASFLCSSLDESFVKSAFLRMADFRIVLVDSEKLPNNKPHRIFSQLGSIDMAIIDDGRDETSMKDLPKTVKSFREAACEQNVAVAIVGRRGRRKTS